MTNYALATNSDAAVKKAEELGMNPSAYNFRALTDPRRKGWWMLLVVDTDGYILNSILYPSLEELDAPSLENVEFIC